MNYKQLHSWDVKPEEAIAIQQDLRRWVSTENQIGLVQKIAGVDTSVKDDIMRAAVVVLSFPELVLLETSVAEQRSSFPYVPGLLSFREIPAVLNAFARIEQEPDLVMVDGQGIAHPRRLGLAAHLGLLLDKPAIGVAKSRLIGHHEEVGLEPGERTNLYDKGEVIGVVVRTKARSKPLYVSIGNRLDLETAVHYMLSSTRGYRLPEPTRRAHLAASTATGSCHRLEMP